MTRGKLLNAEPRTCMVCNNQFTPSRAKQWFCGKDTGRKCSSTSKARVVIARLAEERGANLDPRPCERCGDVYQPHAIDQKTCRSDCPGKPDYELVCANPNCALPNRTFAVKGNSQGKGNQKYCGRSCRDQVSYWRLTQRFRRYGGMTPEEFQEKAEAQNGICMICKKPPVPDSRSRRDGVWALEQDHDHLTEALRDLLCGKCNKGIGMFDDDPALLHAAADYIERHRAS